MVLGLGLVLQHAEAPFGVAGADLGAGMQVSLVSGVAAGGTEAGSLSETAPAEELEVPSPPKLFEVLSGPATASDEPMSPEPNPPTHPPRQASLARGESGQAAGAFEGADGASNAQGGDPLATSDLLAQIARCLRPGLKPALKFSRLTLMIGPDGRLMTPPVVTSALPQVLASDRLVADQIVQAALLCGPYAHPDTLNKTVSLPVDFSVARGGDHG